MSVLKLKKKLNSAFLIFKTKFISSFPSDLFQPFVIHRKVIMLGVWGKC